METPYFFCHLFASAIFMPSRQSDSGHPYTGFSVFHTRAKLKLWMKIVKHWSCSFKYFGPCVWKLDSQVRLISIVRFKSSSGGVLSLRFFQHTERNPHVYGLTSILRFFLLQFISIYFFFFFFYLLFFYFILFIYFFFFFFYLFFFFGGGGGLCERPTISAAHKPSTLHMHRSHVCTSVAHSQLLQFYTVLSSSAACHPSQALGTFDWLVTPYPETNCRFSKVFSPFSLVCALSNSNQRITKRYCNFEFALVWIQPFSFHFKACISSLPNYSQLTFPIPIFILLLCHSHPLISKLLWKHTWKSKQK